MEAVLAVKMTNARGEIKYPIKVSCCVKVFFIIFLSLNSVERAHILRDVLIMCHCERYLRFYPNVKITS